MTASVEARTAARWWRDVVDANPAKDNGDNFQSLFGSLAAAATQEAVTAEQLDEFERIVAERVQARATATSSGHDVYCLLGCDYGPEDHLAAAADETGIPPMRFPWKTRMRVGPGSVRVAQGYGAPYEDVELVR